MKAKDGIFLLVLFIIFLSGIFLTQLHTGINVLSNRNFEKYFDYMILPINTDNQYDDANKYFSKLVSLKNQAKKYVFDEDYSNALEKYDEILEINPLVVDAWYGKIFVLEKMERFDEAYDVKIKMSQVFLNSNP